MRNYLVTLQRLMAAGRDMVTEGRDQGTVVFPDAKCKFYLTAEPRERAARRLRDLAARGIAMTLEEVLRDQDERDRRDAARAVGPMKPADDAVLLDTTGMSVDEVADFLEEEIKAPARRCMSSPDSESFADPPWKKPWYDGWFAIMATLFTAAFSLRTEGSENVPSRGPVLLIANHQSFIDPILVGLAARRHLRISPAKRSLSTQRSPGSSRA